MDDTFMLLLSEQGQVDLLKKTNAYADQYGLCLTDADIQELIVRRRE